MSVNLLVRICYNHQPRLWSLLTNRVQFPDNEPSGIYLAIQVIISIIIVSIPSLGATLRRWLVLVFVRLRSVSCCRCLRSRAPSSAVAACGCYVAGVTFRLASIGPDLVDDIPVPRVTFRSSLVGLLDVSLLCGDRLIVVGLHLLQHCLALISVRERRDKAGASGLLQLWARRHSAGVACLVGAEMAEMWCGETRVLPRALSLMVSVE